MARTYRRAGRLLGLAALAIVLVAPSAPAQQPESAERPDPAQQPPLTGLPDPAQQPAPDAWNHPRALELIARARDERSSMVVDSTMRSYRAQARGHLYFFMDRTGTRQRSLVKADQIALEVLWEAPSSTRQHIVGLRDEQLLPTNIQYHMDHMTVVQDDFGDYIRMGDGDEVSEVPHPAGPAGEAVYDFLLADSLTIRFPDGSPEVRVFELRVRPKDLERPGFIGSVFVDQSTGAIVRMNFSFTPASYVDPYLDYIRVSLDNALWMGRHWLPHRQETELRREIPLLDVRAGSVIRGRFEIRDYEFNVDLPPNTFAGRPVTSVSLTERASFPFEEGLMAGLEGEELTPTPSLEAVRAQVQEVVEDRYLTGLAPLRMHFSNLSDAFRHNRAEGLFLGGGVSFRPTRVLQLRTSAGYAFGRDEPSGTLEFETPTGGPWMPDLALYWNELRDIGGHPGAPILENTIGSLAGEEDYLDPYFARGAALTFRPTAGFGPSLTLRWERHEQASDVVSDDLDATGYRPVRGIDVGDFATAALTVPAGLPARGSGELSLRVGRRDGSTFTGVDGSASWPFDLPLPIEAAGRVTASAGWVSADAPAQRHHLLGGRMTLPGYDYRAFEGEAYWLLRAETTIPVYAPWVGIRLFGAAGATYRGDGSPPPAVRWSGTDSDGVRASLGAGLSLAWDIMRVDLARGVRGGGWEAVFSVSPNFRAWL